MSELNSAVSGFSILLKDGSFAGHCDSGTRSSTTKAFNGSDCRYTGTASHDSSLIVAIVSGGTVAPIKGMLAVGTVINGGAG